MKGSMTEVTPYLHDSLPVPYCGLGEDYSVYPGNVRTTRYSFRLEIKVDTGSRDEADELRKKMTEMLRGAGIGSDTLP